MKVILTGATGFVGRNVLKACIADPRLTEVIAISRRELSAEYTANEKVKVIIHEDFSTWPPEVLDKLTGAKACIWCVGGKTTDFLDVDTARKVQYDYTKAFAEASLQTIVPAADKQFNFVFCSAALATREQETSLYFMKDTRRIKGMTEQALIDLEQKSPEFRAFILRPGGVIPHNDGYFGSITLTLFPAFIIDVTDLAAVMVDIAVNDGQQQTLENTDILKLSKELKVPDDTAV